MRTRLLLISHAATAAQRKGAFPDDDPLDARAVDEIAAWRAPDARLPHADLALASPARCALETAQALGLTAISTPALADVDYGRWRGRRLIDIAGEAPDALVAWTRDPAAAPPDGESFEALRQRVGAWLDAFEPHGTVLAVTHAGVIRAALLHVLQAPSSSFARIEVAPLSVTALLRNAHGGWSWQSAEHSR
jgi:broad specificity phosphatase PhoE